LRLHAFALGEPARLTHENLETIDMTGSDNNILKYDISVQPYRLNEYMILMRQPWESQSRALL
jgi:hypothetical protein